MDEESIEKTWPEKATAEKHREAIIAALSGEAVDPMVSEVGGEEIALPIPEPVGAQNIIELPEPEIHPLPYPRWKARCDSQRPKARYKTNAQKRKERVQRRKAKSK